MDEETRSFLAAENERLADKLITLEDEVASLIAAGNALAADSSQREQWREAVERARAIVAAIQR